MDPVRVADVQLTEDDIQAALGVLRSGALRQGKECEAFEAAFAAKVGAKHALTNANGTAALHLAYLATLQPGDEVLVPAFTFIATASMVTAANCTPIFCEVDPQTFLLDLEDCARKVTPKTKGIVPVHLFGNVMPKEPVEAFAKQHGLAIIWDAAQAHGAEYKGQGIGGWSACSTYSFYPTKNLFVGEGGMLTTDDDELAHKVRFMRSHGQTGAYVHTMHGLNYRMTDVEAAIGHSQLKRLDEMLATRTRNAKLLTEALGSLPGITPQAITPDSKPAWHQFCVLVDGAEFGCDRDTLQKRLTDKGVGTAVYYPLGLHQQPVFEEMYGKFSLPVTENLCGRVLALPMHHLLGEADILRVVEAVQTSRG